MKIGVFECESWEKEYFKKKIKNHKLIFGDHLTPNTVNSVKDCDTIVIFIHSQITKEILDQLPKLKLLATMSTGFNHINLDECKRRKITVVYVPRYGENTIAEHAFGLLLGLSKRIVDGVERTRKNNFQAVGLDGFDLCGKTLGVIGVGNIGKHVVRIGKGFGMKVVGYNRTPDKIFAKENKIKYLSLDELLKNSDIITLHLPLNESTKHIINSRAINKMKNNVVIINTARGELINTSDLVEGLKSKKIKAFGADVLEGEEFMIDQRELTKKKASWKNLRVLKKNNKLLKNHNVIITPHGAAHTFEATKRILDTTIDNILSFIKGNKKNVIKN